jgi:GDPmannose 4,6-dehydratase
MDKTAIITGIKGQDASYLSELLLDKGYKVIGVDRRSSSADYSNIQHLIGNPNFIIEQGDITDASSISRIVAKHQPDEFYSLAAQSFVGASWDQPSVTCEVNFTGVCNCLEAVRLFAPQCRFFQASTSEVYGDVLNNSQDEETPARPRSPYAAAKYGAESLIKVYRDSYGLFACYARSFNHESPRRGKEFVTRKITNWIGESFQKVEEKLPEIIKQIYPDEPNSMFIDVEEGFTAALNNGDIKQLKLGNLDAKRDWTHAKDIVRGMWMMLQQPIPDDYVLGSGETRSVRAFLDSAFGFIGIHEWDKFVSIDSKFYRPADVALLCANPIKANTKLGWYPEIQFEELVEQMVKNDIGVLN